MLSSSAKPSSSFCGASASSFSSAKAVVLPVPYDSTSCWKKGSAKGPQAIIAASQLLEDYDLELGCEIAQETGICTLPPLKLGKCKPEKMLARVQAAVAEILAAGKFPVLLGGEHSLSLGAVQTFAAQEKDFSVLQLDAHADLRHEFEGEKYSHACPMRRIREICPSVVQVGVRSMSIEEAGLIKKNRWPVFGPDFREEEVLKHFHKRVYVTLDVDVFDPAIMPATGTPEPGGISWQQALSLLRRLSHEREIIGFDLVEFNPLLAQGNPSPAFTCAKLAYKMMGYAWLKKISCLPQLTAKGQ